MRARIRAGALALLLVAAVSRNASAVGPIQECTAIKRLVAGGATAGSEDAPNVVYVTGSSAMKPILAALAPILFASPTRPSTIVYRSQGSCLGVSAAVAGTPMAPADGSTTTAAYWDSNSNTLAAGSTTAKEESCHFTAPAQPVFADIGTSDVFAQTCGQALQGLPAGVTDYQGPIQSMTFAVPKNSKESSISAEAAYLVFGLGTFPPWNDPMYINRRNVNSGTQLMIGTAINVDGGRWTGQDKGSSDGVFAAMSGVVDQTVADKSIGIVAADYSARPELKQLAYQHYGQRCGYKPDVQALDKKNTREGRYAIWGPIHLLTQVDTASGFAKKQEAKDLIAYLTGTEPPPLGVDLIRIEVALHVVPPCAMKVQRKTEIGPMTPFKPARACGCAFDKEAIGTTSCKACTANAQCAGNESCNFGYCEKQ
jgi:hypothetical protein